MAKKEKASVSLPKAWKSVKHSNDMKQSKANINSFWGLIIGIIMALVIAFVLLGGISQKGFLEFIFHWSEEVGHKISDIIDKDVKITDDGIYVDPNAQGGLSGNNSTDENSTGDQSSAEQPVNNQSNDSSSSDSSDSSDSSAIDSQNPQNSSP